MKTIFFGTPDFAVPSLRALLESGEEVPAVVTQPDKVKGRGHKLSQPPVKEYALSRGLAVLQPSGIRTPAFLEDITRLDPDCIVVVAYGRIIPPSLLKLPHLGCINVHASLLPAYRGAAPIQWALINGEDKTGVTTMLMDEGLDTGDILLKEEVDIYDEDNAVTLAQRLSMIGASLLIKTLQGVKDKRIKPLPQSSEVSYAPPLKKENGRVDWSLSAREIVNLIRGTYPWPGAYCSMNGEKINFIKAAVAHDSNGGAGGRIEKISGNEILVGTGRGILAVSEVKPEGKKIMTAAAFMHGRHLKEGAFFDAL
ncbi:MAG: methionyl-tRNA formyltransferase [Nitrospirota bacterium]|nr:methionyl-tRNA formyltransferase [Nitrospirota bacterium]